MRKKIIALVALGMLGTAVSVLAQGQLNYSIRVTGSIVAHVYGYVPGEDFKSGNTASETPAGSQTYMGSPLQGSGFSAQLFAANGASQPEGSLTAVAGSLTPFRTGATLGGTIATSTLTVPQVPVGGTGTFQLRVWDNLGGTLTSWAQAEPLWLNGTIAAGKSILYNVAALNVNADSPPNMLGFRSFNIQGGIPEPSTFLLGGLGAAAWLILRHRK